MKDIPVYFLKNIRYICSRCIKFSNSLLAPYISLPLTNISFQFIYRALKWKDSSIYVIHPFSNFHFSVRYFIGFLVTLTQYVFAIMIQIYIATLQFFSKEIIWIHISEIGFNRSMCYRFEQFVRSWKTSADRCSKWDISSRLSLKQMASLNSEKSAATV